MPRFWPSSMRISRRRLLQGAAAAGGLSIATGLYTWRIEPHWVQFVERDLPIAGLPPSLVGARMAQLSDLHIGPRVDDVYLRSVFNRVRKLAPDIVVYTGDFTSYSTDISEHASRMFPHLPNGSRASFGILGNHDYGPDWAHPQLADQLARFAQEAGVQVLRNEVGTVDGLQVIGLDDLWAGRFDPAAAFAKRDASLPAIALSHNPDTADRPGWDGYSGWILSGHTHGGQCKAPFLPPPLLPVKNRLYVAGEYELPGNRRLYVNRGVGHLLRVRINVRPEVTMFQLVNAQNEMKSL